jgi:hypothetical protein
VIVSSYSAAQEPAFLERETEKHPVSDRLILLGCLSATPYYC